MFYMFFCKLCSVAIVRLQWKDVAKLHVIFRDFFLLEPNTISDNTQGDCYTLLIYIIVIHDVLYIRIVLYFISIYHIILNKCVWNFCFLELFCSSIRNENIKRPGFYTLQVTRVFSNFPQLKQLNKTKNTCEYSNFLTSC